MIKDHVVLGKALAKILSIASSTKLEGRRRKRIDETQTQSFTHTHTHTHTHFFSFYVIAGNRPERILVPFTTSKECTTSQQCQKTASFALVRVRHRTVVSLHFSLPVGGG